MRCNSQLVHKADQMGGMVTDQYLGEFHPHTFDSNTFKSVGKFTNGIQCCLIVILNRWGNSSKETEIPENRNFGGKHKKKN